MGLRNPTAGPLGVLRSLSGRALPHPSRARPRTPSPGRPKSRWETHYQKTPTNELQKAKRGQAVSWAAASDNESPEPAISNLGSDGGENHGWGGSGSDTRCKFALVTLFQSFSPFTHPIFACPSPAVDRHGETDTLLPDGSWSTNHNPDARDAAVSPESPVKTQQGWGHGTAADGEFWGAAKGHGNHGSSHAYSGRKDDNNKDSISFIWSRCRRRPDATYQYGSSHAYSGRKDENNKIANPFSWSHGDIRPDATYQYGEGDYQFCVTGKQSGYTLFRVSDRVMSSKATDWHRIKAGSHAGPNPEGCDVDPCLEALKLFFKLLHNESGSQDVCTDLVCVARVTEWATYFGATWALTSWAHRLLNTVFRFGEWTTDEFSQSWTLLLYIARQFGHDGKFEQAAGYLAASRSAQDIKDLKVRGRIWPSDSIFESVIPTIRASFPFFRSLLPLPRTGFANGLSPHRRNQ